MRTVFEIRYQVAYLGTIMGLITIGRRPGTLFPNDKWGGVVILKKGPGARPLSYLPKFCNFSIFVILNLLPRSGVGSAKGFTFRCTILSNITRTCTFFPWPLMLVCILRKHPVAFFALYLIWYTRKVVEKAFIGALDSGGVVTGGDSGGTGSEKGHDLENIKRMHGIWIVKREYQW